MMTEPALIVSALGSSVSAALLAGCARWLYRIDRKTERNHETLHQTTNGPGLVEHVDEHRRALLQEGMIGRRRDD